MSAQSSPVPQGRLTRSVRVPVATCDYSPDGLDETAIDALIEECWRDTNPEPRPVTTTWNASERRRRRREVRRITRSLDGPLDANALVGGMPGQGKSSAARLITLNTAEIADLDGEVA